MKKALILASSLLVMLASLSAQADSTVYPSASSAAPAVSSAPSAPSVSGGPGMSGTPAMGGDHPCKKIADACEAAGFVKGGESSGKGLMKNCLKPIMEGQSVPSVSVSPSDVTACQAKHASHH